MNEPISLSEKLYLLSIHPQKGGIVSAAHTASDYVIAGSLFLELYLLHNIRFERKRIVLLNSKSENKIHEFLLEKIARTDRNLKVGRWFNKFYFSLKHLREIIQQNLSDKRIIRLQERRFLFIKWKSPVIMNHQVVSHLLDEVDKIVFKGTDLEEDTILISMLQPAGLMRRVFSLKERRTEAKKRITEMMIGNQSSTHSEAIEAVKAVSVAITAATAAHHTVA